MKGKKIWLLVLSVIMAMSLLTSCLEESPNTSGSESATQSTVESTSESTAPVTYTVTFDAKGGSAVAEQVVNEGEVATAPEATTREGYDFVHWSLEEEGESYDFTTVVTAPTTLYAVWKQYFTYTYTVDGEPTNVKVYAGEVSENPADPQKAEYKFLYWSLEEDGEAYTFAAATENVTVYAVWQELVTYTYNVDGTPSTVDYGKGDAAVAPVNPEKEGYDFICWSLEENGTAYTFGNAEADVTLYAVWKQFFMVTYHWADGAGTAVPELAPEKVYKGEKAHDVRSIYGLKYATQAYYWHTSTEDNAKLGEDPIALYDFNTPVTANLKLYAITSHRNSWVFPLEGSYDVDGNVWGIESAGKDVTGQATLTSETDGIRFTVVSDIADHVTQLTSPNMGQYPYDAATMKNLVIKYKNFGADATVRCFIYASKDGGGLAPYHAGNHDGLVANMQATDGWQELSIALNSEGLTGSKLFFIRLEFISSAAAPHDNNGTDILVNSIYFKA